MKLALAALVLAAAYPVTVLRVKDGDTFLALVTQQTKPEYRDDGEWLVTKASIRLDCLYAPEKNQDGGTAATAKLAAFLDGGQVTLRTDWKRDSFGRLLGEPYRGDAGFCP